MQKIPLKEVSRGEGHSAWCWIQRMLLIRGGVSHGSLGAEERGQEGDVENREAGYFPGSFCQLIIGFPFHPPSCFNQFLMFLKCLSSKVIWDVFWQAMGSPWATLLASEIHSPPLWCMLAFLTSQPSGDPEFSRKNFQKKNWRCILLILIEIKQVEFSPRWLSANKNSPSVYTVPFIQDSHIYVLLKASHACSNEANIL